MKTAQHDSYSLMQLFTFQDRGINYDMIWEPLLEAYRPVKQSNMTQRMVY